jgi:hypothetical protein
LAAIYVVIEAVMADQIDASGFNKVPENHREPFPFWRIQWPEPEKGGMSWMPA